MLTSQQRAWHLATVGFRDGSVVKNLPAMQETAFDPWVRKMLEEEMTTHSDIFARIIPWTEEPSRTQSMGSQKSWSRLKCLSMRALSNCSRKNRSYYQKVLMQGVCNPLTLYP